MPVSLNVSRDVSSDASLATDRDASASNGRDTKASDPPGRYLVRSGSVYLFQIRLPGDLAGPSAPFVRLGLGALTAREARVRAELLAALARNPFDQIRKTRLENNGSENESGQGREGPPDFTNDSPELSAAELKGYLKAMLSIASQSAPPTPAHQEAAFAAFGDW